jgi:hypothetical protein
MLIDPDTVLQAVATAHHLARVTARVPDGNARAPASSGANRSAVAQAEIAAIGAPPSPFLRSG